MTRFIRLKLLELLRFGDSIQVLNPTHSSRTLRSWSNHCRDRMRRRPAASAVSGIAPTFGPGFLEIRVRKNAPGKSPWNRDQPRHLGDCGLVQVRTIRDQFRFHGTILREKGYPHALVQVQGQIDRQDCKWQNPTMLSPNGREKSRNGRRKKKSGSKKPKISRCQTLRLCRRSLPRRTPTTEQFHCMAALRRRRIDPID